MEEKGGAQFVLGHDKELEELNNEDNQRLSEQGEAEPFSLQDLRKEIEQIKRNIDEVLKDNFHTFQQDFESSFKQKMDELARTLREGSHSKIQDKVCLKNDH